MWKPSTRLPELQGEGLHQQVHSKDDHGKAGNDPGGRGELERIGKRVGQPSSMSDAAPISPRLVYYLKMSNDAPIWYTTISGIMEPVKTLIDSGSSRNFIDSKFTKSNHIPLVPLSKPRTVIAID